MSSTCSSAEDKERHLKLAGVVKGVHAKLRRKYKESGDFEQTWQEHCHNETLLSEYADAMHHLATDIWSKKRETRIDWCRHVCHQYFFEPDGLNRVLEKDERMHHYESSHRSSHISASEGDNTPHQSSDDLEQLAKDINSCPTCSPKKTNTQFVFGKDSDLPPSIVVESPAILKSDEESGEVAHDGHEDSEKPKLSLNPFYEENSMSRDISQATSLETGLVSMQPQLGSGQNSEISDSWENLEEADLQEEPIGDGKVNFNIGDEDASDACEDNENLDADREALYSKYKPVQYNTITMPFQRKIRLLDVGSCFNAFLQFEEFQSIGIDISPAVESVYYCDFLSLEMHEPLQVAPDTEDSFLNTLHSPIETLPKDLFHVVVFSLLLEYFPSPYQRWICCQKAHNLLMMNGLLLIITPDSHSQHRNAPMIKSWKRAIESLGFKRWRYVKEEHLHCMAFRKVTYEQSVLVSDVSPDMLYIPQDFNNKDETSDYDYFFESAPRTEDEDSLISQFYEELPDFLGE